VWQAVVKLKYWCGSCHTCHPISDDPESCNVFLSFKTNNNSAVISLDLTWQILKYNNIQTFLLSVSKLSLIFRAFLDKYHVKKTKQYQQKFL